MAARHVHVSTPREQVLDNSTATDHAGRHRARRRVTRSQAHRTTTTNAAASPYTSATYPSRSRPCAPPRGPSRSTTSGPSTPPPTSTPCWMRRMSSLPAGDQGCVKRPPCVSKLLSPRSYAARRFRSCPPAQARDRSRAQVPPQRNGIRPFGVLLASAAGAGFPVAQACPDRSGAPSAGGRASRSAEVQGE
jgi:hypothetical protein